MRGTSGAAWTDHVGSWHIASVQPVVMWAVPRHRTCRLREGADWLCSIGRLNMSAPAKASTLKSELGATSTSLTDRHRSVLFTTEASDLHRE